MRSRALLLLSLLGSAPALQAAPIRDNSFLIEEAYNQERGVVQHIGSFTDFDHGGWSLSFTQEWPVPAEKHQLGFTLNWAEIDAGGNDETGFSDVLINYRYQAAGGADSRIAFAPRLSLLVPTGDEDDLLGAGHAGAQVNLPLSVELSSRFVTHWNAGATYIPSARDTVGNEADLFGYSFGGSLVWLARPRFNVLLETLYARAEEVVGDGTTVAASATLVSPGLRWAIDFESGLQIVPGVAVPIAVDSGTELDAVLLYLSLEHRFRR